MLAVSPLRLALASTTTFGVAPKFTVVRNEAAIKEISDAVEVFDHELNNLVKKIRAMGDRQ